MNSPLILGNMSWSDVNYDTTFIYNKRKEEKTSLNAFTCYCFILFGGVCSIAYIIINMYPIGDGINEINYSQSGSY